MADGFYATVARYYDAEHQGKTDDLVLYSQLAQEYGGPIFEVACGTGRVMLHLAQKGYEVHGIDIEPAMLERAKRKAAMFPHLKDKLVFYQGDVLKFETDRRFKLVLLPYGGLSHFHEQETQIELLRRLRNLIHDNGLLVLDVRNLGDVYASPDGDTVTLEKTFIEPETGHLLMQYVVSKLDRTHQLLHLSWIYDEITDEGTVKRIFAPVTYRHFSAYEIRLLLKLTGFETSAVYGGVDYRPLDDSCERMLVFARPV